MSILDNPVISNDMEDIYSREIEWRKFENKTVLITGAYGMIASYLVYFFSYLVEKRGMNIKIIAIIRNREKAKECFYGLMEQDYFKISTMNLLHSLNIEEEVHYIFHAAGLSKPTLYSTNPVEVAQINDIGTYYLLQLARKKGAEGFVVFSSGDVYGKMKDVDIITEEDMGSVDPLNLHSCYSESKRMAETWCMAFFHEYQVPAKIARICHTYSPTMDVENDPRVFASFMKCAIEKTDIKILSNGQARRPFCYITDALAAILLIILDGKAGEAYNVCNSDEFLSMYELAQVISGLQKQHKLNIEVVGERKDGYLENYENPANLPVERKLERMGWEHRVNVKQGFANVLEYYKSKK